MRRERYYPVLDFVVATVVRTQGITADAADGVEYPGAHRVAWGPGRYDPADGTVVSDAGCQPRAGETDPTGSLAAATRKTSSTRQARQFTDLQTSERPALERESKWSAPT